MLCVCFDIDGTLVVKQKMVKISDMGLSHLQDIALRLGDGLERFFVINLQATKKIIQALLNKGYTLAFITRATYIAENTLREFEKIYDLPMDSLQGCTFINRDHKCAAGRSLKGEIIKAAQEESILPSNEEAKIILVDDTDKNLANAASLGYATIKASGYPIANSEESECNNDYLYDLIQATGLSLALIGLNDPALKRMCKYRIA